MTPHRDGIRARGRAMRRPKATPPPSLPPLSPRRAVSQRSAEVRAGPVLGGRNAESLWECATPAAPARLELAGPSWVAEPLAGLAQWAAGADPGEALGRAPTPGQRPGNDFEVGGSKVTLNQN